MASISTFHRNPLPPPPPIAHMSQMKNGKIRAGSWVRVKTDVTSAQAVVESDGWHPDLPINAVGYIAGLHSIGDNGEGSAWIVRYQVNDKQTFDCYILGSMLEEAGVIERLADAAPRGETP